MDDARANTKARLDRRVHERPAHRQLRNPRLSGTLIARGHMPPGERKEVRDSRRGALATTECVESSPRTSSPGSGCQVWRQRGKPCSRDASVSTIESRSLASCARAIRTSALLSYPVADPGYALALLESGSAGRAYLLKERVSEPRGLADAVGAAASGGSVVDPKVIAGASPRATTRRHPLRDLTPREHEVLAELAQGKSNGAIAESLTLTKRASRNTSTRSS